MILLSNSPSDGKRLAKELGCQFCGVEEREYPDGEKVLDAMPRPKTADFIYFKFHKESSFDDQFFKLLCLVDKFASSKKTALILPYLPYLRSCPVPRGEIDKLGLVLPSISRQVKKIFLVYPHVTSDEVNKCFGIRNVATIDIDSRIVRQIRALGKDLVLVSPDKGSSQSVRRLSQKSGRPYVILAKNRTSPKTIKVQADKRTQKDIAAARAKTFVLIDDIVSTGSTLLESAKYLKSLGVRKIEFIAVHNTTRGKATKAICSDSLICQQDKGRTFDIASSIAVFLKKQPN